LQALRRNSGRGEGREARIGHRRSSTFGRNTEHRHRREWCAELREKSEYGTEAVSGSFESEVL
jgi:hypothetical protein